LTEFGRQEPAKKIAGNNRPPGRIVDLLIVRWCDRTWLESFS
jgi:hypothetical protein